MQEIYTAELQKYSQIKTPYHPENTYEHAWHLYIIQLQTGNRDDFVESLREENIECSVHYIPLHLFAFYQKQYGYDVGDFPNAEAVFERVVSLPLHPGLSEADVALVIDTIGEVLDSLFDEMPQPGKVMLQSLFKWLQSVTASTLCLLRSF